MSSETGQTPQRVTVVDLDMPFGSMVGFMVKWAVATIPALLILFVTGVILTIVFQTFGRVIAALQY